MLLYNSANGELLKKVKIEDAKITSLEVSDDGNYVSFVKGSGELVQLNLETREQKTFRNFYGEILDIEIIPQEDESFEVICILKNGNLGRVRSTGIVLEMLRIEDNSPAQDFIINNNLIIKLLESGHILLLNRYGRLLSRIENQIPLKQIGYDVKNGLLYGLGEDILLKWNLFKNEIRNTKIKSGSSSMKLAHDQYFFSFIERKKIINIYDVNAGSLNLLKTYNNVLAY